METLIRFVKAFFGILLLLVWGAVTVFVAAAAFGSYFDHSSIGLAPFVSPMLTAGRHLLMSGVTCRKLEKWQILTDYGTDILVTGAVIAFVTDMALGRYSASPYVGIGFVLVVAAVIIQIAVRNKMR